uniref:Y-family DNA polymerase n=1 Tax=Providencia sp. PROV061 TaxID=2936777 RepID=UPI00402B6670
MPTLKNRQRVGQGDFSGVRRQQPMRQNGCSLTRLFLAGILSQLYPLYADFSNRFMAVVAQIVPQIEVYSIDECFCNLTGMDTLYSWHELGHKLKEDVFRCAHLPVGVGISSTKTLAKLANHAAKNGKKRWSCRFKCAQSSEKTHGTRASRGCLGNWP